MLLCFVAAPDLSHTAASHKHSSCRYFRIVKEINEQEPYLQSLTDAQLKAKTAEFKLRLRAGATLDDLLVEAFALVREVSSRVLRLRHFDAQMVSIAIDSVCHAPFGFPCTHFLWYAVSQHVVLLADQPWHRQSEIASPSVPYSFLSAPASITVGSAFLAPIIIACIA
jgi:hypothetical protein